LRQQTQKYTFCFLLLLAVSYHAAAQQRVSAEKVEVKDTVFTHSVSKATWLSTAFPGLGQFYNKKYWKLPIVYGALGTTAFFIYDNNQQYQLFLNAFEARIDDDPTNDSFTQFNERQLIELQNIYRKWRDLSIILTVFGYALNILDAHVDAHLFYYDIDDDLSIHWEPSIVSTPYSNGLGFSLKFNFR
jgi:hypothetical protein